MGCGASCEDTEANFVTNVIDEGIKRDKERANAEVKILLLGAGESGKSTIVKQMRIIHGPGYNPNECMAYRDVIYANTMDSIFAILHAMNNLRIQFSDPNRLDDVHHLCQNMSSSMRQGITYQMGELIDLLWKDEGLQQCVARSREYQLNDSAGYYLNNIKRIASPFYTPTSQDVLKSRVRTIGIMETRFVYKDYLFRIVDVGGQRSQRKKWFYCSEGVNGIIFCSALSGYDLFLEEDGNVNRMVESLKLFESICNNKWFINTTIIIFFNKKDLFADKIKCQPLKLCFPEYNGPNEYNEAIAYVQNQFVQLNEDKFTRTIYQHLTCATDTNDIRLVFDVVTDAIIKINLAKCNLF